MVKCSKCGGQVYYSPTLVVLDKNAGWYHVEGELRNHEAEPVDAGN